MSLSVCNNKHDDIVYDGYHCPLCVEIEVTSDLKDVKRILEKEIETLENIVVDLEQELKELK